MIMAKIILRNINFQVRRLTLKNKLPGIEVRNNLKRAPRTNPNKYKLRKKSWLQEAQRRHYLTERFDYSHSIDWGGDAQFSVFWALRGELLNLRISALDVHHRTPARVRKHVLTLRHCFRGRWLRGTNHIFSSTSWWCLFSTRDGVILEVCRSFANGL